MMTTALQNLLDTLQRDPSWRQPERFGHRAQLVDRLERLLFLEPVEPGSALHEQGEAAMAEMAAMDERLCRSIRDDIRQGKGAKRLLDEMERLTHLEEQQAYDPLDALLSGVLSWEEPDAASVAMEPEMVFYQPTPARHIFDFIERAAIGEQDVVMDLGSGLGHVTILTAICTGARCIGIEREAVYVASARQCAKALCIANASFMQQDVRDVPLHDATVFYLYTPFTGAILRTVLDTLKHEARTRALRVATLGPCSAIVAQEHWLETEGVCHPDKVVLFRSL